MLIQASKNELITAVIGLMIQGAKVIKLFFFDTHGPDQAWARQVNEVAMTRQTLMERNDISFIMTPNHALM